MVKLTGPGLAQQASGSLGSELTFSSWKGQAYLKKHRKPKQPRTDKQVAMRLMMSFLAAEWKSISAAHQDTWSKPAAHPQISAFNAYQGTNLERWRSFQAPSQVYPATEAANPAGLSAFFAFGGYRQVRMRMRANAPLAGAWTCFIFYKLGAEPPAQWDLLVHVEQITDLVYHWWTHIPLPVGQHFYRMVLASTDGKVHWPTSFTTWAWTT